VGSDVSKIILNWLILIKLLNEFFVKIFSSVLRFYMQTNRQTWRRERTQIPLRTYQERKIWATLLLLFFSTFSFCSYCHVSGVPWLITTGSGKDDWICWHLLLQSLLITINDCLRLAPFCWTATATPLVWLTWFWFTSHSLLVYECPLTTHLRITKDEWRTKNQLRAPPPL
jgi:hypothetical protein